MEDFGSQVSAGEAKSFYDTASRSQYKLFPQREYSFSYRGQAYVNNPGIADMAQTVIELRQDRSASARPETLGAPSLPFL